MPLVFTVTGSTTTPTNSGPDPWPANEGDGSIIVTAGSTRQVDILTAVQRSIDFASEVNSIIQAICANTGRNPRVVLYALKEVIDRMVSRNDDITDVRNFTP